MSTKVTVFLACWALCQNDILRSHLLIKSEFESEWSVLPVQNDNANKKTMRNNRYYHTFTRQNSNLGVYVSLRVIANLTSH